MLLKTISVTNNRNVLVQIPGMIIAAWGTQNGSKLEVSYEDGQIIIKPLLHRRGKTTK